MSAEAELQDALLASLKASTAVMALVDGVHDSVPTNAYGAKKAYLSLGPSDVTEDGADCIASGEHTMQIDAWSRAVGKYACRDIVGTVKTALHEKQLTLASTQLVDLRVNYRRVFGDPDGLTTHGVVLVTALIDEAYD
jgi:hypothetical protein